MGAFVGLIAQHGYWIVGVAVAVESMGILVPGETMLVAAAAYAGATHQLNIFGVIATAVAGAVIGDNLGFVLGRRFGYRLLLRHGHLLRIGRRRLKLGQFLFLRHGGKVVFLGRFVAVLRALAASLAGVNRMPWPRFLFFNVVGAVVWAAAYGAAAFFLGGQVERLTKPIGAAVAVAAVLSAILLFRFVRRHEARLEAEAERALPGPPG